MKNKIKEALKTKYSALGLSDAALEALAAAIAITTTEEAGIEAAVAAVEPLLKASQSDTDKVRADKVKLEAKIALLEKGTPPPPEKKPVEPDETPAWAKSLVESNAALTARLALIEGAKTSATRRQQLEAILPEKTPAKYRDQVLKGLEKQTFATDEDFTSHINEVRETAEELAGLAAARGGVFQRPGSGAGAAPKTEVPAHLQAEFDKSSKPGDQKF